MDNEEVNPQFVAYANMEAELQISEVYGTLPVKSNELRREGGALKAPRERLVRLRPGSTRKEITCIGRYSEFKLIE
jgi:hypothetical protein